ncbi:MAG TPA: GNAT family N-acetyltransferase [Casimicrobiaceae bacterium]|nr:GNAT family N-acetyltransferase [Casimicrobiaceae bacterium]
MARDSCSRMPRTSLRIVDSLSAIPAPAWDALVGDRPLLSHAFLHALHETGCAAPETGWTPRYLTAWRSAQLVGAMPLYVKTHSYGEYVFDWSWADAYRRHGRHYYPKLVCAVPFTPATGPRLIAFDAATRGELLAGALDLLADDHLSSLHILFPQADEAYACAAAGMLLRDSVQFHWTNPGYRDFADFLSTMNHTKRKRIRQERRKLGAAGVSFRRLLGREIDARHWSFFFRCYTTTYRRHHSTPYLSLAFFERIGATLPDHVVLVLGERGGRPVCAALDVFGADTLWGRYWGATEFVPGLHFEACYYQAIEFCIERRIAQFEGGAQGVHKLARGLLPVTTHSAHAIADPDFARAIARFAADERAEVAHAVEELEAASPFKVGLAANEDASRGCFGQGS